jgi:hypothetical protein
MICNRNFAEETKSIKNIKSINQRHAKHGIIFRGTEYQGKESVHEHGIDSQPQFDEEKQVFRPS